MLFQKKIDRAFDKLHEEKEEERKRENIHTEEQLKSQLEKGDLPALIISALITILPVALLGLLALCAIGYFFFFH